MVRWSARCAGASLLAVLVLLGVSGKSAHAMRSVQGEIVINEVQADPAPSGSESGYEWVELFNPGGESVSLSGWQIADNRAVDPFPDHTMEPGAYVIVAGERFRELFPEFSGALLTLPSIGNGLGNGGDQLRLVDAEERVVDAMSYGDDATAFDPPAPAVSAGHSLERVPAGVDTDSAADWSDRAEPSPGGPPRGPARPPAPTAGPVPTAPPTGMVRINEHLPAPRNVDWDGDGEANRADEWIELFNAGSSSLDLRGWQLDDEADGGSSPYVLSASHVIPARGHLLIFQAESGVMLNNGGDTVRLVHPDGRTIDTMTYGGSTLDGSWALRVDGGTEWVEDLPPSPGGPNGAAQAATPPAPPSASPTAPTATPSGTASPGATRPVATATDGSPPTPSLVPPGTPTDTSPHPGSTGTPDHGATYLPFLLSEVLYDPPVAGHDAASEWVELHNRSDRPASLEGWSIGDRRSWDALGDYAVPPRGYAVLVPMAADGSLSPPPSRAEGSIVVPIDDGRIGGGLGNRGDIVRLRGPTGRLADAVSWGDNLDAFDPAVPSGPPGASVERIPPDLDTDRAADWFIQPAPSPGGPGTRPGHLDAPPVRISEVLPSPWAVDWDGDGTADHRDEWVELHNSAGHPVSLDGWTLSVGEPVRWTYRFTDTSRMSAGEYRALHRATTGLALGNDGDTLVLTRADGVVADRMSWDRWPGADRSLSRAWTSGGAEDGELPAVWHDDWAVTPGGPNRPREATSDRARGWPQSDGAKAADRPWVREAPLGALRELSTGTRVMVRGRVTAPPGVYGEREMYLGDPDGGVRLYLRYRDHRFPGFRLDDPVAAIGRLRDYRGERQVVLDRAADAWWEGTGPPVRPAPVRTGAVGEALEGRLVWIRGRAVGFAGSSVELDDGSGAVRVSIRPATQLRRPWLERGQWWAVVGIVGQAARRSPWTGGYRVTPRYASDLGAPAPHVEDEVRRFPATGAGGPAAGNTVRRKWSRDAQRTGGAPADGPSCARRWWHVAHRRGCG